MTNEQLKIGEFLKKARLEKGIELKFISQRTKINLNILKKIEDSRLEELPNRTYVKNFIQQYVREIGLDLDLALKHLDDTYDNMGFENDIKSNRTRLRTNFLGEEARQQTARQPIDNIVTKNKSIVTVISIAVVAIVLLLIIRNIQKSPTPVDLSIAPTPIMQPTQVMTSASTPITSLSPTLAQVIVSITPTISPTLISTIATPIKTLMVTPTNTPTKIATQTQTPTVTPVTTPTIVVTKSPELSKNELSAISLNKIVDQLFTIQKDAPEIENKEILPTNIKYAMSVKDSQNVFINAFSGDAWLYYKVDDKPTKGYTLQKGRTLFLRGKEIRLFIGNTTAAKVFYNGALVQFNSKTGVKSLVFPQQNATNYHLPLFFKSKAGKIYTSDEIEKMKTP